MRHLSAIAEGVLTQKSGSTEAPAPLFKGTSSSEARRALNSLCASQDVKALRMKQPGVVRVLMLEEYAADAEVTARALRASGLGIEVRRAESEQPFKEALTNFHPDIVLLDWTQQKFNGEKALKFIHEFFPEIPAIVVTGILGDEQAVKTLQSGAADFVLKDRLARLGPAIVRALDDEKRRRERITAQREMESNLILLRTQQESSPDGILVVDGNFRIVSHNQRFVTMWGIPEDLLADGKGDGLLDFVAAATKDPEGYKSRVLYLHTHPAEKSHEELDLTDGRCFDRHSSPMFGTLGAYLGRVWFFRDVTDQRAAEENLRRFRALIDKSNDSMEIIDQRTLRIIDVNERACVEHGYTREEMLAMSIPQLDLRADAEHIQQVRKQLQDTGTAIFESAHRRKDGTTFPVEVTINRLSSDLPFALAIARDITEHKRAQQALEESEVRFRALIEDALDPVAIIERDGTIRYTSPATREMSGYDPAELLGLRFFDFLHPEDAQKVAQHLVSIVDTPGAVQRMVARIRRKDGAWRLAEASVRNQLGVAPIDGLVVTLRDVTARERTARALRAMSAVDATLVRATSEQELAEQACRIMVEIGGYRSAWIGYPQNDVSKSIQVIAQTGEVGSYLERIRITWDESERGRGPSGMAVRTGKTQVARDYPARLTDPEWQEAARRREYVACIAIPLAAKNSVWGVLTLYADNPEAFDHEELELLEQMAADVSYGIEAMRDRQQHALDLERLEKNMEATIHALSATMERRDPYTAGHQTRVARLCRAIAGELGLSSDQTRGLELAALIHDVGKIEVPAEVLSKPGRLTDLEFALIKLHPRAGYQIVRNIDFPWPVATMVLQHHERMDGSGYPEGLHGEEILLESRILQVADVVEAISSHRPYRAALGIEQALAEVTRGSGTRFDRKVVEACRKVLLETNFRF